MRGLSIKKKKANFYDFIISVLYIGFITFVCVSLISIFCWTRNVKKNQSNNYYEEMSQISFYIENFYETHKDTGFNESEEVRFKNYIFDKWHYDVELETNLNEENIEGNIYFSVDLYTHNQNGERIKFKNYFHEN